MNSENDAVMIENATIPKKINNHHRRECWFAQRDDQLIEAAAAGCRDARRMIWSYRLRQGKEKQDYVSQRQPAGKT